MCRSDTRLHGNKKMNSNNFLIEATGYDFTGWIPITGSDEQWNSLQETYRKRLNELCDIQPSFAVFGFRTCEYPVIMCNNKRFIDRVKRIAESGLNIVFALSPMHQRFCNDYIAILEQIKHSVSLFAIQVNDIGTACIVENIFGNEMPLIAGRLFEKTIRECRFSISQLDNIEKNKKAIEKIHYSDPYYFEMLKSLHFRRAECDTIPDGTIRLPESEIGWDVIYPKIMMSKSARCFFDNNCEKGCRIYRKHYKGINGNELYFQENGVFMNNCMALSDAVFGKFRLIYSEIAGGYL